MKLVVLDGYTLNPGDLSWSCLEDVGELTVYDRTPMNDGDIISRIGDAELVFTNKTPVTGQVLKECPNILYIGVLATGYNVVDCDAAAQRGIPVVNIPSYGTDAVGQFAIALLLEICHHIGYHSEQVHQGAWTDCADWCFWDYPLVELSGKTMGVIGFGRIGQVTGRIAKALGMKVVAFDCHPTPEGQRIADYVSLDELYCLSDVIVLHCPLYEETYKMINKDSIAQMKDGVIIINNSRGPLIVEEDLAEALKSGKVYAAAVDVTVTEPIDMACPLLHVPNCIITPHISWAPKESRQRLMDIAADNVRKFLLGHTVNVVNGVKKDSLE